MKTIVMMYVTLLPVFAAGAANRIFCQLDILKWAYLPIDGGMKTSSGKPILGDHKTWKGFWGMIVLTAVFQVFWGFILNLIPNFLSLSLVASYHNDFFFNLFFGFLLGCASALFELPNSFIKRRFNIPAGQLAQGNKKWIFLCLDQIAPFLGSVAVIALFNRMTFSYYIIYVLLGGATAFLINCLLLFLETKRKKTGPNIALFTAKRRK
ncbi:CDP-archaeol synthase [Streptococcus macacae]|uniref:Phosphatidate cytidylyltransferase-like protein n=1 Tax=Streptococcus macacae NCTC 11558 TaxID=764298 RepID=G5JYJ7_9STRE|nr:CDP-archaeol synthase [Streptococcus macacae]EHJ51913.1 phosphatidate cytidylyltransferase-like protein [Streptococcus macacae NCTC 11558]SUN78109.1 CDP-diglyceride synthetase [Streptococcus macacae NCTC 11558]